MQNKRNRRGFTLAELLIVVAIITVLAGVSFIAVHAHQKSMANLEANAIAKEIFIAAQNHLTQAESQGYLGDEVAFGKPEDETKGIYYFNVPGDSFTGSVLGLMLPFGSIDETVRAAGNYVVRYQANPALVLDVFYGAKTGRFKIDPISKGMPYLLTNKGTNNLRNDVIGWYGGAETQGIGATLNAPVITVQNAERLTVTVDVSKVNLDENKDGTDKSIIASADLSLQLIITNADGTAMAAIPLDVSPTNPRVAYQTDEYNVPNYDVFVVTLDDVTAKDMHFADINSLENLQGTFKPGEDITVYAVAYSNKVLCNIVESNAVTTNSLFADVEATGSNPSGSGLVFDDDDSDAGSSAAALIANFRHLVNLDAAVSKLHSNVKIDTAKQIDDLVWADDEPAEDSRAFTYRIGGTASEAKNVCIYDAEGTGTAAGCYLPISPAYDLTYEGGYTDADSSAAKNHSITGVVVAGGINGTTGALQPYNGPAGLFGTPKAKLTVKDLALIDFNVSANGNAGALVGALSADLTVNNVVAYNSENSADITVKTTNGSVGGLVGSATGGTTKITDCAAALVVSSDNGDAGGLIGTVTGGGTMEGCYAGGHTEKGMFYKDDDSKTPIYNVTATGYAGGLVGNAGTVSITNCYATCSAQGATVGGFAGSASYITNCYAAGMVAGRNETSTVGALVGNLTGSATGQYFEAVNPGLPATGIGDASSVTEIDENMEEYRKFIVQADRRIEAKPYDAYLTYTYTDTAEEKVKFNFKGIAQLGEGLGTDKEYFVATHYGDWPVPGIQVQNTAS